MGSIRKSTLGFLRARWKTWKWSTKLQRQPRVDVVYRRQPRAQVWAEESHEWSAMQHFQAMIKPWDIRREDGQPRAFFKRRSLYHVLSDVRARQISHRAQWYLSLGEVAGRWTWGLLGICGACNTASWALSRRFMVVHTPLS
jgi:hypothetical protein